jgi:hypothetical protein
MIMIDEFGRKLMFLFSYTIEVFAWSSREKHRLSVKRTWLLADIRNYDIANRSTALRYLRMNCTNSL